MTLLIEQPSVWLFFFAWRKLKTCGRVIFFQAHYLARNKPSRRARSLFCMLLRRVNPRTIVQDLHEELAADLSYDNNYDSDRFVQQLLAAYSQGPSYRIMLGLLEDSHIENFYKIRALPSILYSTQFLRTARHLMSEEQRLVILPAGNFSRHLRNAFIPESRWREAVPLGLRSALAAKETIVCWIRRLLLQNFWVLLAAGPMFMILQVCRAGFKTKMQPLRVEVIHPLVFGINEDGVFRGIRTGLDDRWTFEGEPALSDVAYYFSDWEFPEKTKELQLVRLKRMGIPHFDSNRLPLTWACLKEQLGLCAALSLALLRHPGLLWEEVQPVRISASLFYHFLRQLHLCRMVEFKVQIEHQDYSPAHVIRTLVANRLGRSTVGMHHAVPEGPFGLPGLRYVHINRYGVWGSEFARAYQGFWDSKKTYPVGAFRMDRIAAAQESAQLEALQARYQIRFGGIRPLVVILLPTLAEYHLRARLSEFFESLRQLKNLPGKFQVVLRFRSEALLIEYMNRGLDQILLRDSRLVMDLAEFTTSQWIALSDAVIVSSVSTGMIEAAGAGKPCFSFDTMKLAERVFSRYGKEMILKDRHALCRVLKGLESSFSGWDCRWSDLAADYNYFPGGKNIKRFQNLILEAMGVKVEPVQELPVCA